MIHTSRVLKAATIDVCRSLECMCGFCRPCVSINSHTHLIASRQSEWSGKKLDNIVVIPFTSIPSEKIVG